MADGAKLPIFRVTLLSFPLLLRPRCFVLGLGAVVFRLSCVQILTPWGRGFGGSPSGNGVEGSHAASTYWGQVTSPT